MKRLFSVIAYAYSFIVAQVLEKVNRIMGDFFGSQKCGLCGEFGMEKWGNVI